MMCAHGCCATGPSRSRAGSTARRSAASRRSSRFYGRTLEWVLGTRRRRWSSPRRRWRRRSLLYLVIPKGFFPVQDTGVIMGISEAPQTVSFPAMAERQQALARVILAGPGGREPVVVHRHRRHQHDAQQRPASRSTSSRSRRATRRRARSSGGCSRALAAVEGDHAVHAAGAGHHGRETASAARSSSTASRTPTPASSRPGCRASSRGSRRCRCCATWRAISRTPACRRSSSIDRSTACAARHHAADGRRHALRRLRPAPDLDDVHAAEPVPRGARDGSASSSAIRAISRTCYVQSAAQRIDRDLDRRRDFRLHVCCGQRVDVGGGSIGRVRFGGVSHRNCAAPPEP